MAGQTQTLLQSLVARGLAATANPDGSFTYHTALYIGRGVPDAWIVPGQHHLGQQPDLVRTTREPASGPPTA